MATAALVLSASREINESTKTAQPKAIGRYTQIPSTKLVRWEGGIVVSHAVKQHLWKVAAIATLVGFIALAVAASLLSQIYAPAYFPLALAFTFPLAEVAYQQYLHFDMRSQEQGALAKIEKAVEMRYVYYDGMYTSDKGITVAKEVGRDGIALQGDIERLLPVIARYEVLREEAGNLLKQADEQVAALRKIDQPNFDEVKATGARVAKLREQSLITKVQAAYLRGLLCNPACTKDWHEICTIYHIPEGDRRLAEIAKHPSADLMLVFKDKSKGEISRTALDNMMLTDLSNRLFA